MAYYLPGLVNDVFISYTHKDNQVSGGEDTGWVSHFHLELQKRLTELLGAEAVVWRDKKLGGCDDFSAEIFDQLKSSAVLVPVLSPGYMRSTWCQNELEEFQKASMQTGGFQIGTLVRAAKAVKTPLDEDRHREILGQSLGFEFYEREQGSPYFNEFEPGTDAYKQKLDRLTQDIVRILKAMQSAKPHKGTVYLAETSSDLRTERQKLLDELHAQGYRVLPDRPLPEDAADIRRTVQAALQEARCVIVAWSEVSMKGLGARGGRRRQGTQDPGTGSIR